MRRGKSSKKNVPSTVGYLLSCILVSGSIEVSTVESMPVSPQFTHCTKLSENSLEFAGLLYDSSIPDR
ncbi:hypothetical protein D5086_012954 [Populus alba]|uniref:Uncharacterized protein n=1 Tax=Populus alba TaxID=43335 RepID=A0ACC4C4G0_POPAL